MHITLPQSKADLDMPDASLPFNRAKYNAASNIIQRYRDCRKSIATASILKICSTIYNVAAYSNERAIKCAYIIAHCSAREKIFAIYGLTIYQAVKAKTKLPHKRVYLADVLFTRTKRVSIDFPTCSDTAAVPTDMICQRAGRFLSLSSEISNFQRHGSAIRSHHVRPRVFQLAYFTSSKYI